MINQLIEILEECSVRDWDGYNANPVKDEAIVNAILFYSLLKKNNIENEIDVCPEPSGDVCFGYNKGEYGMLISILTKNNEVSAHYGGIMPSGRVHGEFKLVDGLPSEFKKILEELK